MIKVGSDFSGVGAFNQALIRLGIKYEEVFACDMDKYARQTFILNYGEPKYYPENVYEREIPTESLDIFMTSPPCQSFSLAGKRKGEDSKNGVLFYNSHEFIVKNNPRYFIFENVKGLLSDDSGKTFQKWIDYLGGKSVNGNPVIFPHEESVPYHVYYQVMNAKHYGVPQNRERIFIIGIRDDSDNNFSFPKPFPLEKRLKDVLESEVDEKYFLSDKMIDGLINTDHLNSNRINNAIRVGGQGSLTKKHSFDVVKVGHINQDTQASQVFSENGTSPNICAGTHGYALGYVETENKLVPEAPIVEYQLTGGKWDKTHEQSGRVYDKNGIAPTIHTMGGGNQEPKIAIGAIRGRNPTNPKSRESGLETEQMLEINENGTSNALTTVQKDNVVVIKFERTESAKQKRKESLSKTGKDVGSFSDRQMIGVQQDFSDTILANANPQKEGLIIIPANNSKGYDIAEEEEEEDSINFSVPNSETRRGRVGKKVSQTLDTQCNQGIATKQLSKQQLEKLQNLEVDENIAGCITNAIGRAGSSDEYISSVKRNAMITQRIRRLTPRECANLMDFPETMKFDVSDSQIYKQMGNSIVVGVLALIIEKLKL